MSEDNTQEDCATVSLVSEMSTVEPSDEQPSENKEISFLSAIFNTEHLLIVLIVLFLLVTGMSCSYLYNRLIKLIRDHRIIQKHLKRKRKGRLSSQKLANSITRLDCKLPSRESLVAISLLPLQPADDVEMRDYCQTRETIFIPSGSSTVAPRAPGFTTFGYDSSEDDTALAPRTIKTIDSQHNSSNDPGESTKTNPEDESNSNTGGFQEGQVHRLVSQPSILHFYRNFMNKRSLQSYII